MDFFPLVELGFQLKVLDCFSHSSKRLVEIFKKTLAEKYYDMGKIMKDLGI